MRERARVFLKLVVAQHRDIFDAFDRGRIHVGAELLLAEHREAFFQTQLKPVAAGHAVAGPVVKIFMADDRFDVFKIGVDDHGRVSQDIMRVEDVQTFVFHRAHVEVADCDDIKQVQVVFAAVGCLVPRHRAFQRFQCMRAFVDVARAGEETQVNCAAAASGEPAVESRQGAGHDGEQIGRFGERVMPGGEVATVVCFAVTVAVTVIVVIVAAVHQVAVAQQLRELRGIGAQSDMVDREVVRAVDGRRDAAKPFRFALRA